MSKTMLGTLKVAAMISVFLLALIGVLFVLDLIPHEYLKEVVVKLMAILAILTAAALGVAAIAGSGDKS